VPAVCAVMVCAVVVTTFSLLDVRRRTAAHDNKSR